MNPPFPEGDEMDRGDDWGAEAGAKYSSTSGKARGSAKGAKFFESASGQESFRRSAKSKMEHMSTAPVSDREKPPLKQKSFASDGVDPQYNLKVDASLIHYRDGGEFIDEGVRVVRTKHKLKSKSTTDVNVQPSATGRAEVEYSDLDAKDRNELGRTASDKHRASRQEPPPPPPPTDTIWPDYPEEQDHHVRSERLYQSETAATKEAPKENRRTKSDKRRASRQEPPPPETRWPDDPEDHHAKAERLYQSETAATKEMASPRENREGPTSRAKRRPQAQDDANANHRQEIAKPKEHAPDEVPPQM
jgi:hypothetical protein